MKTALGIAFIITVFPFLITLGVMRLGNYFED